MTSVFIEALLAGRLVRRRRGANDLDHGAGYGNTLTWETTAKPRPDAQLVEIQFDLDTNRFYRMFAALMTAPTPAH